MRRVMVVLGIVLVVACGGGPPAPSPEPPEAAGAGIRYTCGVVPFDPAVLDQPGGAERGADPVAAALRAFLGRGGVESDGLPDTGWIHVGGTPALAEFVARDEAADWDFVSVERRAGAWIVLGWGGCRPTAVLEALSLATWTFPPDAGQPGPQATSFEALVNERACTSGQEMGDRLQPPLIDYGPTEVTVLFGARPLLGGHDCPGNPSTRVEVELREPLGDRRLVDGAFFPPGDPAEQPQ